MTWPFRFRVDIILFCVLYFNNKHILNYPQQNFKINVFNLFIKSVAFKTILYCLWKRLIKNIINIMFSIQTRNHLYFSLWVNVCLHIIQAECKCQKQKHWLESKIQSDVKQVSGVSEVSRLHETVNNLNNY